MTEPARGPALSSVVAANDLGHYAAMELCLQQFKERAKKRKWSPQENCGFFAIEGWNAVAPVGSKLDPKRAREDIKPSMVSDPRVKRAIQAHRLLTGGYPSEITPRRLGDYIEQLPGAQEEVTPR